MIGIHLDEDWHVHSTFSDGSSTIVENVTTAEARGLRRICLVDHVRDDTGWVPDFVAAARQIDRWTPVSVLCGVEAKILDTLGTLDLPPDGRQADYVFAADHQLPTPSGPMHPDRARELLARGELGSGEVLGWLIRASANAVLRHDRVVLAHPFSILPKLGLGPDDLDPAMVGWLAAVMSHRGARAELSERWRCPEPWIARAFLGAGVEVLASTDSHAAASVGRYEWVAGNVATLRRGELTLVA